MPKCSAIAILAAIGLSMPGHASEAYDTGEGDFVVGYSTRPFNFLEVMRTLDEDARRCGAEIETRTSDTAGGIVIIGDGGFVHIWIVSDVNEDQRACMSAAVETLHERLYDEPNIEEN